MTNNKENYIYSTQNIADACSVSYQQARQFLLKEYKPRYSDITRKSFPNITKAGSKTKLYTKATLMVVKKQLGERPIKANTLIGQIGWQMTTSTTGNSFTHTFTPKPTPTSDNITPVLSQQQNAEAKGLSDKSKRVRMIVNVLLILVATAALTVAVFTVFVW